MQSRSVTHKGLEGLVASQITPGAIEVAKEVLVGKRVLLVEDSGFLCFALEQTLREAGCEVVGPCCRLADALLEAAQHELDCALLDINLRGEMVSPLAAQLRERGVPFVLTSAPASAFAFFPSLIGSGIHS